MLFLKLTYNLAGGIRRAVLIEADRPIPLRHSKANLNRTEILNVKSAGDASFVEGQYVLLIGTLTTGFSCYGPFIDELSAFDFRYTDPAALLSDNDYVVVDCTRPELGALTRALPTPTK